MRATLPWVRMMHPRMFAITDPVLARVRALALALPEAVEVEAWGRPTFRAGTPMFAVYGVHDGHDTGLVFKPDPDERAAAGARRALLRPAVPRPRPAGSRST